MVNPLYIDNSGSIVDFYALFNLQYDAGMEDVRTAFRQLIKRYHPDITGETGPVDSRKVEIIIRGYKVLMDEDLRRDYDRVLFSRHSEAQNRFPVIPGKRINYSVKLADMLRLKQANRDLKRKDVMDAFGQDVEILVTRVEAARGALAYISLPARMVCPACGNSSSDCWMCGGMGYIPTTSQLEVKIPPHVDSTTVIDVDMKTMKPSPAITFRNVHLRIRITVIS